MFRQAGHEMHTGSSHNVRIIGMEKGRGEERDGDRDR